MEVPANFTVTVNADLKVGTLQETVTVSGAAPVVDVQQASRTQVMTRDIIDTLPTSRNIMSVGQLVLGVRSATPGHRRLADDGAAEHADARGEQPGDERSWSTACRSRATEGGMPLAYFDDALASEVERHDERDSGGHLRRAGCGMNIIPKDGGNVVSGAVFLGGTNGTWQSDNVDDELRARNIRSANGIAHIQNFNGDDGRAGQAGQAVVLHVVAAHVVG